MASCLRHFSVQDSVPSSIFSWSSFSALPLAEVLATEGQAALLRRALADGRGVLGVIPIGVLVLGVARRHGCPRWRQGCRWGARAAVERVPRPRGRVSDWFRTAARHRNHPFESDGFCVADGAGAGPASNARVREDCSGRSRLCVASKLRAGRGRAAPPDHQSPSSKQGATTQQDSSLNTNYTYRSILLNS